MAHASAATLAPVEYAVAVDRYLAEAGLGPSSRRVYRISLTSWAWPLVGKLPPTGRSRRLARPPTVPLARWIARTPRETRRAVARRAARQARTLTGSSPRSAAPSAGGSAALDRDGSDRSPAADRRARPVAPCRRWPRQRAALFQAPAGLREQALWHLLQDTGASAESLLGLDAGS